MAPQEPFITDPRLPIRTSAHVLSAERSASKGSSWAVHVVQKARFADLHVPDFLCVCEKMVREKNAGRVGLWKRAGAGSVKPKEGTEQKPACGFVVGLSWCPVSRLEGCVVDNIEKKRQSS